MSDSEDPDVAESSTSDVGTNCLDLPGFSICNIMFSSRLQEPWTPSDLSYDSN